MNEPVRVHVGEGAPDTERGREGALDREGPLRELVLEEAPLEEVEHAEGDPLLVAGRVDAEDVPVRRDPRERERLPLEAERQLFGVLPLEARHLDGAFLPRGTARAVDRAHAAAAYELLEDVAPEQLAPRR